MTARVDREALARAEAALAGCIADDVPPEVEAGVLREHGGVLYDAVCTLLAQVPASESTVASYFWPLDAADPRDFDTTKNAYKVGWRDSERHHGILPATDQRSDEVKR